MGGKRIDLNNCYYLDTITGCWIWKHHIDKDGYGRMQYKGKSTPAHRVLYEKYKGPIPVNMQLDHVKEKCKRRDCVNPDHMEPVTAAENSRRSSNSILTKEQVKEIKLAILNGETNQQIAYRYPVSYPAIHKIRYGERWKDI